MKKLQDIIKVILLYVKKSPLIIATNAFPSFLVLILLSSIISGGIFAFTIFSLKNVQPDIGNSKTAFKKEIFLAILSNAGKYEVFSIFQL